MSQDFVIELSIGAIAASGAGFLSFCSPSFISLPGQKNLRQKKDIKNTFLSVTKGSTIPFTYSRKVLVKNPKLKYCS